MELETDVVTIVMTLFLLVILMVLFFGDWFSLRRIFGDKAGRDVEVTGAMATTLGTYDGTARENFFRLCILILDYASEILRDVLQEELEKKYPGLGLYNVLDDKTVRDKLFNLKGVFNRQQQQQLYPDGKNGSPSTAVTVGDLDLTLTVLLLRNITTLNNMSKAWDSPSESDTSKEAEIGRVKRYRNVDYGHIKEAAISIDVFREKFSGLKSSLLALSARYSDEEYDAILREPLGGDLLEDYQDAMNKLYNYDKDVKEWMMEHHDILKDIQGKVQVIYDRDQGRSESWIQPGDSPHVTKPDTTRQAPVMSPTHKNLLVQMGPMLKENLEIEDIMLDMVDRGIFSEQNAEKVNACKIDRDKADEFLRILPKCGPRAFETFVEVLKNHNRKDLSDLLADKAIACSSKNQMASFYIKCMSQIQRLPWDPDDTIHLDEVYVNLQWVKEEKKPTATSSVPIQSYTSIFNDTEQGKTPKRLLVRGKAGIGKTTFTQKMATDWANTTLGVGKSDEVLSQFKHLLILNLRSIQPGQTLKEAMETQITRPAENRKAVTDEVMQAIDYDGDHVLLVCDGYDEYDINTSIEITDIIYRKRYQNVCTVITTRPWKAGELMDRRIMDGVYEITGLTEDNIAEYVAKFFYDKQTYDKYLALRSEYYFESLGVLGSIGKGLVGYLHEKKLMSLVNIPILLLFICLMWQTDQESDACTNSLPASYTLLYKKLIQLLLRRRYNIKTQEEMEQSACVRKLEKQIFISLGKLAYDGLVKPDGGLIFNEKDLQTIPDVNELYSLGLLSKSKVHSNFDVKHEVTFPHKTIQEFFAAKYLARELDENDSNILDQLLENLNTTGKLYNMSFVLRFLCGLSRKAATKVLRRGKSLHDEDDKRNYIYKYMGYDYRIDYRCRNWCNNLLLEHWYAYCPQEKVLPPELFSWHTELYIPESFEHSDPKFQQVLQDSMCSPQVCSGLSAIVVGSDFDTDLKWESDSDSFFDGCETHHITLSLLSECDMFHELVVVLWLEIEEFCEECRGALNHVLSKAPNLQIFRLEATCKEALLSIPNPGKLLHLDVKAINGQDCQVIQQMKHLRHICIYRPTYTRFREPLPQLGAIPNTSHDLTRIDISFTPLRAVGVQLLGRNLRHVPGLEHLTLADVFMQRARCAPSRCTCPRGEDTIDYDRCQDVCEAVRELSQGVMHTTKLKDFSFRDNHLGLYHGITSPLIALVQSLSTVSQQTGMEIYMSCNNLGRVDRLSELIEAIVSSYQHVSSWDLMDNNLKESLPQPDDSLKCKVSLHVTW